jgi:deazaflavin-dependent oxidoreductase (nitroreductase family)
MAKSYRPSSLGRLRDGLMAFALRKGVGPPGIYLLTVAGRKTGTPHSTPVAPHEDGGERWLVAPYGEVGWVRNARAAGRVTLQRGKKIETLTATELSAAEAAPVLKRYLAEHPRTVGAYFDAGKDASLEEFAAEAARHPVFKLDG